MHPGGEIEMPDTAQGRGIHMEYDTNHRYRCNQCQRVFMVSCEVSLEGRARCPACLGDDVMHRVSRRDRLMRFLMLYEAA
jgi:hypothetical protein